MGPLLGLGLGFLTDLVSKHGEALVTEGVKAVTGIDLNKKEPTAEDKQLILDAEFRLKELDFKTLELSLSDKKEDNRHEESYLTAQVQENGSARDLQKTALGQDDLFSKRFVYYFASFWSITAALYIMLVTFMTIPAANIRFVDTVIGFMLGTVVSTIIGYFFGSSLKKEQSK